MRGLSLTIEPLEGDAVKIVLRGEWRWRGRASRWPRAPRRR